MKKFWKKLAELAAVALIPVIMDVIIEQFQDLKKKIEDQMDK